MKQSDKRQAQNPNSVLRHFQMGQREQQNRVDHHSRDELKQQNVLATCGTERISDRFRVHVAKPHKYPARKTEQPPPDRSACGLNLLARGHWFLPISSWVTCALLSPVRL